MMPAASSLRDFLVAEGRRFLPNLKHGRRGGKNACGERQSLCQEEVMIIFVFRVKAWQGIRVSRRVLCGLLPTLEKKGQLGHPLTGAFCTLLLRRNHAHHCF
jgi:hypothetical protein